MQNPSGGVQAALHNSDQITKHCDVYPCRCRRARFKLTLSLWQGLSATFSDSDTLHISPLPECSHCSASTLHLPQASMPRSDATQASCLWAKGENYTEMSPKTCSSTLTQNQPSVILHSALFPNLLSFSLFLLISLPRACFCIVLLGKFKCVSLSFTLVVFAGGCKCFEWLSCSRAGAENVCTRPSTLASSDCELGGFFKDM